MSQSPSPRTGTPLLSTPGPARFASSDSFTPSTDSNIRSRFSGSRPSEESASPTSTTMSNQSRSVFSRPSVPLSLSSALAPTFDSSRGKITIRADPALVTCFDPADKELYDLWAPKR